MKKRNFVWIGCVGLVLLTVAGSLASWKLSVGSHHREVVISDETEIGPQWKEFRPSVPLPVENEEQFVAIEVRSPYSAWKGLGITLPSGELVNPEIKAVSKDGIEYDMTYYESTRARRLFNVVEYAEYVHDKGLPKSESIEKILLRSESPIPVKRIFWSGFNWKDRE